MALGTGMRQTLAAIAAGLLFGAGLAVSGMADRFKVLGFLTLDAHWDPSLAFVMAGALAVTIPGFAWLRKSTRPLYAEQFTQPPTQRLDRNLLAGAAIFGAGWGLAGYCPGPALVSAGLLQTAAWVFLPCMLVGAWLADLARRK